MLACWYEEDGQEMFAVLPRTPAYRTQVESRVRVVRASHMAATRVVTSALALPSLPM